MLDVINVDLDGVLFPWHEIVAKEFGIPVNQFTSWNVHETIGISKEVFDRWHEQQQRLGLFNRTDAKPPVEGVQALEYYSAIGYRIRILTHRLSKNVPHSKVCSDTVQWLDDNKVPYWEIAFVGKDANKGLYLADFAIDDKPENVRDQDIRGIVSFMLERPWNYMDIEDVPDSGSWGDFTRVVERVHETRSVGESVVEAEVVEEVS